MLTYWQIAYLKVIIPASLDCEKKSGIPKEATLSQAVLEGAGKVNELWRWGASPLVLQGNNFFGIKKEEIAGLKQYGHFDIETHELVHGLLELTMGQFQVFPSVDECFAEHARLLSHGRYAPAFAARADWREFIRQVMNCGYSTDRPGLCQMLNCPHYAGKLIHMVEAYGFNDPLRLGSYLGQAQDLKTEMG